MPPVSQAQRRFFRWADEHPEESGVSRKVSEEFNRSDPGGKLPEHVATGGIGHARGGAIGGMHLASNIIPKGHLVPGFSGTTFKPPKPEGVTPSSWTERTEARQMDRPIAAAGGAIGMQMGGDAEVAPWFERSEARNELDMPGGGFLHSGIAGRTDRLPIAVAADSHVIPADVIAGLGQDNSLSGANVMKAALRVGPYGDPHPQVVHGHGPPRAPGIPGEVEREMFGYAEGGRPSERGISHTLMAGAEFVIPPHDWTDGHSWYRGVRSLGDGDVEEGHRRLREMTAKVRKHHIEFLKSAPEPKR